MDSQRNKELAEMVEGSPLLCLAAAIGVGIWMGSQSRLSGLLKASAVLGASQFFQNEIRDLKSYAVRQAIGVVKDAAVGAVSPGLAPKVSQAIERATQGLAASL